jgi:spermidine synthase
LLISLGVGLVAAAVILYEVALSRLFSIAYGYHFAFLAISLGLLGFGASGTLLALRPGLSRRLSVARLALFALGASVALVGGFVVANFVPFDPYQVAWEPVQLPLLAAYLVSFAAPFLLAGIVLGLPLTTWPDRAGRLYGANLAGSGIGGLAALAVLDRTGASAAVVWASLVAALGALAFAAGPAGPAGAPERGTEAPRRTMRLLVLAVVGGLALLIWSPPPWLEVRLSPYKPLPQLLSYPDAEVIDRRSNAVSRLDVVASSGIHSAPGLSLQYQGPLPEQTGVVVDGEVVLALTSSEGLSPGFFDAMPTALPYRLRPQPGVLVLEPGGGLEVLAGLEGGARSVVAVEKNALLADAIRSDHSSRAGGVYNDPRVRLVVSNPRGYLSRSDERFDVIALALPDNRRAVTAGAFSLSENYLMTAEAFDAYLERLTPNGLLVVHRWLQLPPTEELRAGALVVEALERAGKTPAANMIAIRSFSTMLILAKQEPFDPAEIELVKTFVRERTFDLVHYPGIQPSEANRANVLRKDRYFESFQALLSQGERFYDGYEYDVRPPTDARPFFFHFFKWEQTPTVVALLGKTWQPFGGSGYLIVVGLAVVVSILSLGLVLAPLVSIRRRECAGEARHRTDGPSRSKVRPMIYFAGLGLGFLLVEVALVQRFILFLDHSAQAFAVVLFGLLVASGIGSALSVRAPWRLCLGTLVALISIYPLLLSRALPAFLGQGLAVRIPFALALLAPLGLLMGIPFPHGLRLLGATSPARLPLAWGVNGFASVMSAILAAMVALSWGFPAVFAGAAVAYTIALLAIWSRKPG